MQQTVLCLYSRCCASSCSSKTRCDFESRLTEQLDARVASRVSRLGSEISQTEQMLMSVPGFKFRRRKITNFPTGGEGSCAHLVEATPCDEPSCFSWQLLRLEECIPAGDADCGPGKQLPQIRCVDTEGERHHTSAPYVTLQLEWNIFHFITLHIWPHLTHILTCLKRLVSLFHYI